MTDRHSLTETVRARLKRLHVDKRFNQTVAATRLNLVPSAVSRNLTQDGRPLTLEFVEAISELAQVPIAELVAPLGSTIKQLDPDEAAILRALRLWPRSVRQALAQFFAFFANEPPVELQARNLIELWRGGDARERRVLYALAQLLREKALGQDILEGLERQLLTEAKGLAIDARKEGPKRRTT